MNHLLRAGAALVLLCCFSLAACDDASVTSQDDGITATAPAVDARAAKVDVCHYPEDNPANRHVISISENAVPAHLSHGDNLYGEETCDDVDNDCDGEVDEGLQCGPEIPVGCPNPGTCDNFQICDEGGTCGNTGICATTAEGGSTGACLQGTTVCAGLADCTTSADCADGGICAVETCCGRPVCVPQANLCQPSGAARPIIPQLLQGDGPTIGRTSDI